MAQEQLEIEKVESSEECKDEKEEKVICIAAKCRGPGPAKYLLPGTIGLKGHDIRKQRCPAFSFGQRHKEFSSSFSPGPKYMFPAYATRKGRETAPAFSLHSRTREKANFLTPGPGILKGNFLWKPVMRYKLFPCQSWISLNCEARRRPDGQL